MNNVTPHLPLKPGWYLQLLGNEHDLTDWCSALTLPYDPVAIRDGDDVLLHIRKLSEAQDATEVKEQGLGVVSRLNGAMALMHNTDPVRLGWIMRVDDNGSKHRHNFAEAVATLGRMTMTATITRIGSDGLPAAPEPPRPSSAQIWNTLANNDNQIADLLEQLGKAQGWYEIYKTIEASEIVAGGKHKLKRMLGTSTRECMNMRETANFYRHAHARRPTVLTTLMEATPLLYFMVRTAIDHRQQRPS